MRIVAMTLIAAACVLPAAGCRQTPRYSSTPPSGEARPASNDQTPFWAKPRNGITLNQPSGGGREDNGTRLTGGEYENYTGVLAGRLVDNADRPVAKAYVQVSAPEGSSHRPIEVAADDDGYFLIPGLQPGRGYLLTARAQSDGRMLAGRAQAIPPQPRLVIRLTEELASASVPPLPPHPGNTLPGRELPPRPFVQDRPAATGSPRIDTDPGWSPGGAPRTGDGNPAPRIDPVNVENIAEKDKSRDPRLQTPPAANIPSGPKPPAPDPPPGSPGAMRYPTSPGVPSCYKSGNRLINFALYDVDGRPWEFRNHHGRLVLLDFWGTWCPHCIKAMPELADLQRHYGPYGLEVVGIACEQETGAAAVQKVKAVMQKHRVNYTVLMAEERSRCPVQSQLAIDRFPTLILIDDFGNILWRGSGAPVAQVKAVIHQRLGR